MEGIVLAGGLGKRLRSVVPDLPKPMAPVGGRPFLEVLLELLAKNGFTRIVMSVGYRADIIMSYFGPTFRNMELVYEIEQTPLGTGGAVRLALESCEQDHVYIFNGDTFLDLEVDEVEAQWRKRRLPLLVAREVPNTQRYGRLEIVNERVTGFISNGDAGAGLINAGCYVFPPDILDDFAPSQPFSLESDFLALALSDVRINVFQTWGRFIDIGVPEDYMRAQTELSSLP